MDRQALAKQYFQLKEMHDELTGRLEYLASFIKNEFEEGTHVFDDRYSITIQVKNRTAIDEDAFWALATAKDLTKEVPDKDKIEEAYLNGELTDTDLRAIRKPQYSTALIAKRVDKDV